MLDTISEQLDTLVDGVLGFPTQFLNGEVSLDDWAAAWAYCFLPLGSHVHLQGYLRELQSVTVARRMDAQAVAALRLAAEVGPTDGSSSSYEELTKVLRTVLARWDTDGEAFTDAMRFVVMRLQNSARY